MANLTTKLLEEHQERTLETLDKEIEDINKKMNKLAMQLEIAIGCKARFMSQILIAELVDKSINKN